MSLFKDHHCFHRVGELIRGMYLDLYTAYKGMGSGNAVFCFILCCSY